MQYNRQSQLQISKHFIAWFFVVVVEAATCNACCDKSVSHLKLPSTLFFNWQTNSEKTIQLNSFCVKENVKKKIVYFFKYEVN